ncbi:MAG: energy transducer TonB [Acidobacteria bacterium]|nr:energy transducer TonB [Acidobacteriota bacterium]
MSQPKTPTPQPPPKLAPSTAILVVLFGLITLSGVMVALWVENIPLRPGAQETTQAELNPTPPAEPPAPKAGEEPPQAAVGDPKAQSETPLNKNWAEMPLKPAPKAVLKAVPAPASQAPVPVKTVTPPYPPLAKAAKVQGAVTVVIKVDAKGVPVKATVLEGPTLLRASALEAAKDWRFRPARHGSEPVASEFVATFQFRI